MPTKSELQEHIAYLKKQIAMYKDTEILMKDQRFKNVILKGFCEDEMHRNMGLAVCDKLPLETRELCNNLAKASAALNNYLNTNIQFGITAEEDLEEAEEALLQIEGEE